MHDHMDKTIRILETQRLWNTIKLTVYDAVVKSKLMYGLETMYLGEGSMRSN